MKVLLAIDGSETSLLAEQALQSFPSESPPEVRIVTVCPTADMHALASVPGAIQAIVDQNRARSQELLDQTAERCRAWAAQVEVKLLDGHPATEILRDAESQKPDLIVVGARGLGAVSRFFLGSVSDQVARHAPCAVLVVRGEAAAAPTVTGRVVIAYDGSAASEALVDRFAQLPASTDRQILLVSVIERVTVYGIDVELNASNDYLRLQDKFEPLLKTAAAKLEKSTPNVSTVIHYSSDAADNIVESARKFQADLIAIGSRSRNSWERLLLGSVALRVLHHAPCSVWIERPPQSR